MGTVFLLTDAQVPDEGFLVLINDLLASGEIADLFAGNKLVLFTCIWLLCLPVLYLPAKVMNLRILLVAFVMKLRVLDCRIRGKIVGLSS